MLKEPLSSHQPTCRVHRRQQKGVVNKGGCLQSSPTTELCFLCVLKATRFTNPSHLGLPLHTRTGSSVLNGFRFELFFIIFFCYISVQCVWLGIHQLFTTSHGEDRHRPQWTLYPRNKFSSYNFINT